MRSFRRLALTAVLAVGLAGCVVPHVADLGDVTIPPQKATAPEDPRISPACRAALTAAGTPGTSALAYADESLGYWAVEGNPPGDVQAALDYLTVQARAVGVEVCP